MSTDEGEKEQGRRNTGRKESWTYDRSPVGELGLHAPVEAQHRHKGNDGRHLRNDDNPEMCMPRVEVATILAPGRADLRDKHKYRTDEQELEDANPDPVEPLVRAARGGRNCAVSLAQLVRGEKLVTAIAVGAG